jgi:hypothetical protein
MGDMKTIKIGVSESTDSLTPRRLSRIRPQTPITANVSLKGCQVSGKKLNNASAPLETERLNSAFVALCLCAFMPLRLCAFLLYLF